jgi:hypothetical protein
MYPPPPLPSAPSAAVTNSKVALALIAPPSPVSPAPHGRAGGTNLFRDGVKKRHSDLPSTGYSPAKKKGGRRTCNAGISPCDANEFADAGSDGDDDDDEDYSPTPAYKIVRTMRPKRGDAKVILNSTYFAFLCPLTFDTKRFIRGHPQVYSEDKIVQFEREYQKQLLFDFSAMGAIQKKSASMDKARASCLRKVDLDVIPSLFSCMATDCHELPRYVLEDLQSCLVGCCLIVCIRACATGNLTEVLYSDQVMHILQRWKENELKTETWRMAGDSFFVIQGKIIWATLHDELISINLSCSRFTKYFTNRSGDFGISFDSCETILSVLWHDVIHYLHVMMFFGWCFDQLRPWGPVFRFKTDPEYAHHIFCQFASEYFGDLRA